MTDGISDKMESVALSPDRDQKRPDYLEWSEYFMAVSFLSAMRSKDPATQVIHFYKYFFFVLKNLKLLHLVRWVLA